MECELSVGGGDSEPIEGFTKTRQSILESVKCYECDREIPAGEVHEIATGDMMGEPFKAHVCDVCAEIAAAFSEDRVYGQLWQDLEEFGGESGDGGFEDFNSGCLSKLQTAKAKEYIVSRYRDWKGLA